MSYNQGSPRGCRWGVASPGKNFLEKISKGGPRKN